MRVASIGSGSRGNCLVIQPNEASTALIMVDCGFSTPEVSARLTALGVSLDHITAICVTHEHNDHIKGVETLAKRQNLPIYLTHGTFTAHRWRKPEVLNFKLINSYKSFECATALVEPYPVPHDAKEPAQFVFSTPEKRLGVLTDAGHITPHMINMLSGCHGLVLECNHDQELLNHSNYPWSLKQRVGGTYGHLNNQSANHLLQNICKKQLKHVIGAHLSQQNNTPQLAYHAISTGIDPTQTTINIACQDNGFDWVTL
jgi:phosphoribosyl 1,2-cyclic phosphodiesterase